MFSCRGNKNKEIGAEGKLARSIKQNKSVRLEMRKSTVLHAETTLISGLVFHGALYLDWSS